MLVEIEGVVLPDAREELVGLLQGLGYEAKGRATIEERGGVVETAILLWVATNIGAPAAQELAKVTAQWVIERTRGKRRPPGLVRVLLGPDGEVLAEVHVPGQAADDARD